jgi:hypothetical protein
LHPREGGSRELSGRQKGEAKGAVRTKTSDKSGGGDKKSRKQRAGDLGRALRSVYDDTVREEVPEDFLSLLGRLT